MINLGLLLAKYLFIVFLYLFLFWTVRAIASESRTRPVQPEKGGPRLTLRSTDGSEHGIATNGPTAVGRLADNDIVVEDSSVSGYHARITGRNGSWLLEDLDSSNGTFLNNTRVTERTRLKSGDVILFGRTRYNAEIREVG